MGDAVGSVGDSGAPSERIVERVCQMTSLVPAQIDMLLSCSMLPRTILEVRQRSVVPDQTRQLLSSAAH